MYSVFYRVSQFEMNMTLWVYMETSNWKISIPLFNVWFIKIRTTRNLSLWLYEYFWIISLHGQNCQKSHNTVTNHNYIFCVVRIFMNQTLFYMFQYSAKIAAVRNSVVYFLVVLLINPNQGCVNFSSWSLVCPQLWSWS